METLGDTWTVKTTHFRPHTDTFRLYMDTKDNIWTLKATFRHFSPHIDTLVHQ